MSNVIDTGFNLYNEKKFKEAYDLLFEEAAYNNNAEAQYLVGKMCHDGDGVEKSVDEAMKWWKKATRNGQRDAAFAMSEIKTSTKNMF